MFHKENDGALENHTAFLRDTLLKDPMVFLVTEARDRINGFVIGALVNPPPVYNPGGKVCLVDDFMVESSELWPTLGRELLRSVWEEAKAKGAVLMNVVCGPKDGPIRGLLSGERFDVVSEWHVGEIH